jgi:hypothetical protein
MKWIYRRKGATLAAIGIAVFSLAGCVAAQQEPSTLTADDNTIVLLEPDANGALVDKKQGIKPVVKGVEVVDDARFGKVLQFSDADGASITVPDGGKFDFSRGVTLEAWLQLQKPDAKTAHPGGTLFAKMGSFWINVKNDRLSPAWLTFPTVPVATSTEKQYKYYPLDSTGFGGYTDIPANQWVHVALSYNPVTRAIRTWVNGKLDVEFYYVDRDIPGKEPGVLPLLNDTKNGLIIGRDLKNARIAEIRVSNKDRAIEALPPFETYVQALPYRKQTAVAIDHIDPERLPLNVVLKSGNKELQRVSLADGKTKVLTFAPPVATGQYPLTITATSGGKQAYTRSLDVYAGDSSKDPVRIDEQNRLIINGKPVFPLMAYHTFLEDVPILAKLGFNMFTPRYPDSPLMSLPTRDAKTIGIAKQYLDAAKANNIYAIMGGGIFGAGGGSTQVNEEGIKALTNDPGLALWYGSDEPGKKQLEQLQPGYTAAKQLGTRPIVVVTNMTFHTQKVAEVADIVGVDPYPIPNVSLRAVADHTRYASEASHGLKPVFTAIPQYRGKQPTVEELRCMAYLAVASGANGLGIYAWDDRQAITKKGWYTKENPEDLKVLQTVIAELSGMQDVLVIPNSTRKMAFAPVNQALHAAFKESGNESYLMIVNDSRVTEEATLSVDGLQSADGVSTRDANDKLAIRGGKVLVQLPPLGAKLFKLSNIQKK